MDMARAIQKALARICLNCPVCRRARSKQKGLAYFMVRYVEGRICPACRAYEAVYGVKAYEPRAKP
jgi:hypothetical protein